MSLPAVHPTSGVEASIHQLRPFTFRFSKAMNWDRFVSLPPYQAGMAFVRGEVEVEGDFISAIDHWDTASQCRRRPGPAQTFVDRWRNRVLIFLMQHLPAGRNIRFHYDRSNEFYQTFLDSRMVYSCAYFSEPGLSLEAAQLAKLDHICTKLRLSPGDAFLDIGCGWGALVRRAAGQYGAASTGYTLSDAQFQYATGRQRRWPLPDVSYFPKDFASIRGRFGKAASVGMFEHVGRHRARAYFRAIHEHLEPDGLFLNHSITRRAGTGLSAGDVFLQRHVFPGYELLHVGEMISAAEETGFEVLDVENLRPHYALTCRAWTQRLRDNSTRCTELVGPETYRIWLLYLAGASLSFRNHQIDLQQVLLRKRGPGHTRAMTRSYMYRR